jgi:hypothetical protein
MLETLFVLNRYIYIYRAECMILSSFLIGSLVSHSNLLIYSDVV